MKSVLEVGNMQVDMRCRCDSRHVNLFFDADTLATPTFDMALLDALHQPSEHNCLSSTRGLMQLVESTRECNNHNQRWSEASSDSESVVLFHLSLLARMVRLYSTC